MTCSPRRRRGGARRLLQGGLWCRRARDRLGGQPADQPPAAGGAGAGLRGGVHPGRLPGHRPTWSRGADKGRPVGRRPELRSRSSAATRCPTWRWSGRRGRPGAASLGTPPAPGRPVGRGRRQPVGLAGSVTAGVVSALGRSFPAATAGPAGWSRTSSRPTRPSTRATPAAPWPTAAAAWSGSTPPWPGSASAWPCRSTRPPGGSSPP